ncbi:MAG: hypothetical protein WAV72_29430, partial [Bradyrhizobium sp.]
DNALGSVVVVAIVPPPEDLSGHIARISTCETIKNASTSRASFAGTPVHVASNGKHQEIACRLANYRELKSYTEPLIGILYHFVLENEMPDTPAKSVISGRENLAMSGHVRFPRPLRGAPIVVASAAAYSWDTNHPEAFRIFDAQVMIGRVTAEGFDYMLRGSLAGNDPAGWTHSNLLYYIATDQ